jgi:hypothetical protein
MDRQTFLSSLNSVPHSGPSNMAPHCDETADGGGYYVLSIMRVDESNRIFNRDDGSFFRHQKLGQSRCHALSETFGVRQLRFLAVYRS